MIWRLKQIAIPWFADLQAYHSVSCKTFSRIKISRVMIWRLKQIAIPWFAVQSHSMLSSVGITYRQRYPNQVIVVN